MNILSISAGIAWALSLGNKVLDKMIMAENIKYKTQYKETIKSFNKLCRKSLQDKKSDESAFEPLNNIYSKYLDESKKNFSHKYEHKNKINFFIDKKLKFNLERRSHRT